MIWRCVFKNAEVIWRFRCRILNKRRVRYVVTLKKLEIGTVQLFIMIMITIILKWCFCHSGSYGKDSIFRYKVVSRLYPMHSCSGLIAIIMFLYSVVTNSEIPPFVLFNQSVCSYHLASWCCFFTNNMVLFNLPDFNEIWMGGQGCKMCMPFFWVMRVSYSCLCYSNYIRDWNIN